jgi:hypothetical protein
MEANMPAPSNPNPVIATIAFRKLRNNNLKGTHSEKIETIALIMRWSIAGICLLVIALPTIISIASPI